jgi:SAM-dependent methyltransferase
MRREQRLVFGEVAELYDRHRPAYPDAVVDDPVELAGLETGSLVLEVGAGTGKATAMFAARRLRVLAVEPSAEMAAVARWVCAGYSDVRIERSDFERWDSAGRTFALVFAAQAWHWVDPVVGFAKAADVLRAGGELAAFWNRPVWAQAPLREVVLDAYQRAAPELLGESDPIHPGGSPPNDAVQWRAGVAAAEELVDAETRDYEWSETYSARRLRGAAADAFHGSGSRSAPAPQAHGRRGSGDRERGRQARVTDSHAPLPSATPRSPV